MNTSKDVLDAPLTETIGSINSKSHHTPMGMLKLDFGVNVVLLFLFVLGGLAAIFDTGMIMLMMICAFFLGCYQLLSGLIGSLRGNREKLIYFVAAIAYLAILSGVYMYANTGLGESFEVVIAVTGLVLIPMAFACYYTKLCYDALKEQ